MFNPFSTRKVAAFDTPATPVADTPEYAVPQHGAYVAPSLESGSPYNDEFGWSPRSLRPSAVETPSAQRLGAIPRHDFRPDPNRPADEGYLARDKDDKVRHSVENINATGWTELKGVGPGDKRWADNPRRTPPPESRSTQRMAPRTYDFTRPFAQDVPRLFNGSHFSMADHKRSYDILGMRPVQSRRNTYRIEPVPWDTEIVDMPPAPQPVAARVTSTEVPYPSRTWRI